MHYVVDRLGLFLYGFLFGFKAFFRWFTFLILHWFNHEELALFAAMFVAPRFIAMPTQSFGRSFVKLVSRQFFWCGSSDGSRGGSRPRMVGRGVTLILRASWFNRSSWICVKEITAIRVAALDGSLSSSSTGLITRSQPLLQRCSRLHEGAVGLDMAGQGVTLVLRASWFNRSS
ncbi:hypothetical protein GW17_00025568 [Ensete ventricosum]|nr:hypothetical protein GW17_00025568 [Ensete ventricosum]